MTMTVNNRYYLQPQERDWVLGHASVLLKDNAHRIEKRDKPQGFRCIKPHWKLAEGCYAKNFGPEECGSHAGKWGLLLIEHLADEVEEIVFSENEEYDHVDIVCDLIGYKGDPYMLDWMFQEIKPKHMAYTIEQLREKTHNSEIIQDIDIKDVMEIAYENMEEEFAEAGISSVRL